MQKLFHFYIPTVTHFHILIVFFYAMRKILFILFLFSCIRTVAQNDSASPVLLTHITDENGLSDNRVTCVYKDKTELLWVGTKDGLNLLDGSMIRIFKNDPADSNSILDNFITAITEDRYGKIWISTSAGFCWYDKRTRHFVNTRHSDDKKTRIGGISSIAIDKQDHLWMGSTGNGLLEYDPKTKKLSLHYNSSLVYGTDIRYSNRINKVIVATDQLIWLATADGLWNYSSANKTFTKIIHKENGIPYHPLCMTVYEDHAKNIWAGFWNTGLKKYEPATGAIKDHGAQLNYSYSISSIMEMPEADGRTFLWLNGKLFAYNENKNKYFSFPAPLAEKDLPNVNPVYRSDDGWLWLTSDNGLYIYNPQQQFFDHQLFQRITSQGIVFADHQNDLLVGAQGVDFLKQKDHKNNIIKDHSGLRRKDAAMLCMLSDGPGDLWLGSSDGILHTDLVTGEHRWFYHIDGDSTSLPRDFIAAIFIDSKRNCWIFPWREGIWQMDMITGRCKKVFDGFMQEAGKIKKLLIGDAKEDVDGNIWMADLDEGIILYDAKTGSFSKPFEKDIGSDVHTARLFLHNNWIYTSLPNALAKWDIHERKLQRFPLPAALNKPIYDFCPDKKGNWWLGTAGGLIVFNEKENSFRRFTTADGLYQNDVDGTLFCAANGQMIIGTPTYFSFFDPQQLTISSSAKKNVILTEFVAGGRAIDPGSSNHISLRHNENNIVIRWALPAYNNPFRNSYYYQLQGIDTAWRYAGNTGEVQYATLSPGSYTIFLKATTANGAASANIIHLHFVIDPPFWKTWWFITIIILLISSLFFAVVRYISQRNLKEKLLRLEKEQAVEKERNRISRDMHDDLGSGLTKIAIMSEVVKKQIHEPEKAKQQLENISESSRELVDNLQDIIWVLNPKNDTLESLAVYIREYGVKFFEPFGIAIHFNYPDKFDKLKLSEETRRNIFLVIKETFNNIAKHAWSNNVAVTVEQDLSTVIIIITDDGKGFDQEKIRPFSNGLTNMKNRIEQVGGEYSIDSEPGKGTKTSIKIYP